MLWIFQTIYNKLTADRPYFKLPAERFYSVPLSLQDWNDTLKSYGIHLGVPNQRN